MALAPRTSSPHARLVCIARTRFPKPGRRNVSRKFPLVRFVGGGGCRLKIKWYKPVYKSSTISLEKAMSAYLSMQYTNRSSSPIRSLSLAVLVLHCSLHGFHFLLYRSRLANLLSLNCDIVFQGPGLVTIH